MKVFYQPPSQGQITLLNLYEPREPRLRYSCTPSQGQIALLDLYEPQELR